MAKRERILGDLISDFLDRRDRGFDIREGVYRFEDGEEDYLNDIDNQVWTHSVRRNSSVGDDGKPGLVDVYVRSRDLSDVFSSQDASTPSYVTRQYQASTYDTFLELAINDPGRSLVRMHFGFQ